MTKPDDQWWCINGAEIMRALHSAHNGADPDILYIELIANSDEEDES